MQQFLNNWSLQGGLAVDAGQTYIALPNGTFKLTWSDKLGADETRHEIMLATVTDGLALLDRGLEGTDVQEWPAGSFISIRVTAGWLNDVSAKLESLQAQINALQPAADVDVLVTLGVMEGFVAGYAPSNELGDLAPKLIPWPGAGEVEIFEVLNGLMEGAGAFMITLNAEVDAARLRSVDVQGLGVLLFADASVQNPAGQTLLTWMVPDAEWLTAVAGAQRAVRFTLA